MYQLMEQLPPKMGNPLVIFVWFICFKLALRLIDVSNKYYYDIVSYYLSAQHKVGPESVDRENVL